MNEQQFEYYKSTIPDFEKKHCFWIDPEELEYDPHTSQTRALGHVIENIPRYAEIYKDSAENNVPAPFPPASARKLPNNNWQLKDGCTRRGGAAQADKKILVTDYQDTVLGWGPDEWSDFQGQANDHPRGTPNTDADMKKKIAEQLTSGRIDRLLGYKYGTNKQGFVKAASKHFRHTVYKNSGKDLDWFRRAVKKALKPQTLKNYENYSSKQAFEYAKLRTGFQGEKTGEICGNEVFYVFYDPAHKNPNMIGFAASKIIDNPNIEVSLVYYVGGLVGKGDHSILNERKNIEDWFDKVNKSALGIKFKNLYFLPQIKSGLNKEDLNKIIKSR